MSMEKISWRVFCFNGFNIPATKYERFLDGVLSRLDYADQRQKRALVGLVWKDIREVRTFLMLSQCQPLQIHFKTANSILQNPRKSSMTTSNGLDFEVERNQ